MKKSVSFWQWTGFVFTSIAGTLLHFAFDWSGQSPFWGLFSAVNESIWEHMKLLFFPLLAFSLIESRYVAPQHPTFWCTKLLGTLVGLTLIPVLYYTYTGALGVYADWFNITIFFLAAAAVYFVETKYLNRAHARCVSPASAVALLCLLAGVFFLFTFAPPRIPLFQDPLTKTYGI